MAKQLQNLNRQLEALKQRAVLLTFYGTGDLSSGRRCLCGRIVILHSCFPVSEAAQKRLASTQSGHRNNNANLLPQL
jgi:hypothetical protein